MSSAREVARAIVEHLPEQASWDDVMCKLYVKQKIDAGLEAAERGDTVAHEEVKAHLLRRRQSQ